MKSIFHAHNWKFEQVRSQLERLRRSGFDGIQLSPAQKSPPGAAWYLRYQPLDHLQIEGLGDRSELKLLCRDANRLGLTIIADLVFNHMAVPENLRRSQWLEADKARLAGDPTPIKKLYDRLSMFPDLSVADFQPWRDMQGDDWDNEHRYESWGNGEWPELKPTERVLALHCRHIGLLFDCGVRGFRFDAVKHMRAEHIGKYMDCIAGLTEKCWVYGEVFSDRVSMHREYDCMFPTTDFPFVVFLKKSFKSERSFVIDPQKDLLSQHSVRFGLNHDLILNPAELVSGFLFDRPDHSRIANCLATLLRGGTSLIYMDDFAKDPLLGLCLQYRNDVGGIAGSIEIRRDQERWVIEGRDRAVILDLKNGNLVQ